MSQLAPSTPTCPTDCTSDLPAVDFSKCAPKTFAAQLNYLFLTSVGYSMTDWTDAAEWASRMSNSAGLPDAIRTLFVIGSKPKPETQKIKISLGREIIGKKKHTIAFKIDEVSDTNREFVRLVECGGQFLMWYGTTQLLWGDNSGIECSLECDQIITDDSGQIITIEGTITWESKFTPKSIANPISI